MTTIQDKVGHDWTVAMKARDPKKDVLSLVKTELKNMAINTRSDGAGGTSVSDDVALDVLTKMAKQRRESIASYQAANRQDLVDKEAFELSVIEAYLPKKLTDDELKQLIQDVIKQVGATSIKDLGKVMGGVLAKAKGRVEGSQVQAMVKAILG